MRIAFVGQDLFAQGAQHVKAMLTCEFIARGYDVDLVVSRLHKDYIAAGKTNMFKVPESTRFVHLNHRHARQCVWELRKYIRETKDLVAVISMSENYAQAVRVATLGLRHAPQLVYVEHSLAGYDDFGGIIKAPARFSLKGIARGMLWKTYSKILVVSQKGVGDFVRMNPWLKPEKVVCVNNPSIGEVFYNKLAEETTHPWLKEESLGWKTFVCAGAFNEYKGHEYLLKAMKIVADRGEKVRVVLFGQGPLEAEYRKYIAENKLEQYVSIGGYVKNFPAEAKAAHAFVLSSTAESFGLVLVEALACGCQVVSTDPPFGPREILADGKYGILVPPADPEKLAEGILATAEKKRIPQPEESWKRYTIAAATDRYADALGIPRSCK